jgi:repressor LexA
MENGLVRPDAYAEVPMSETPRKRRPLTDRQRRVLETIQAHIDERGYPPSVREIGEAVGLASPSSVHSHLNTLEVKGYLRRDLSKPRAIEVTVDPDTDLAVRPGATRKVPLVGEIAAGGPIVAEERVESVMTLPQELVGEGDLFVLRVRGESMIEAGVLPGDLVVVRQQAEVEQGEMCAAMIDGEATVKYFRRRRGKIVLEPANAAFEPITLHPDQDNQVLGKVVATLRSY